MRDDQKQPENDRDEVFPREGSSVAATDGGTSYGSDEEMLADFRERMKPLDSAARNSDEGFDCDVCGEWHDTRPFEVLMKKPEPAAANHRDIEVNVTEEEAAHLTALGFWAPDADGVLVLTPEGNAWVREWCAERRKALDGAK